MRLKADSLLHVEDWLTMYGRTAAVLGFHDEVDSAAVFPARAEQSQPAPAAAH
jgi:hypothetical protein